jgi:hypothetical protein
MKDYSKVDYNQVVSDYKAGKIDYREFYSTFDAEKKRFMLRAVGTPEIEAVFDDTLMAVTDEWQSGNSFIGLLRLRLESRLNGFFRAEAKRRYYEHQHVQHYLHFTRNPMLVKQHEVEFFDFLDRLEPVLKKACELLIAGYTMNETSKQLGFKDQRTLKSRLQKAFAQFLDSDEEKDKDKDK